MRIGRSGGVVGRNVKGICIWSYVCDNLVSMLPGSRPDCCTLLSRMVYVHARVGTCPIAHLCSAGARLHLGKQERLPPAFLVLHAPLSHSIDCPRDMLDAQAPS